MARPLRIEVRDGICHVTRRGLERRAIVRDDADRRRWLGLLEGMATRRSRRVLAWEEVLGEPGSTLRAARREYRRFVCEGRVAPPRSPFQDVVASTLLGSVGFIERMKTWLAGRLPGRNVAAARALRREVAIEDVAAAACREHGVSLETLRARGRHGNEARSAAVYLCRRFTRAKIGQIGAYLGGVDGSTVSHIARAVTAERRKVRGLDARLAELEAQLRQNADPKT
jgi:hypothetical protein